MSRDAERVERRLLKGGREAVGNREADQADTKLSRFAGSRIALVQLWAVQRAAYLLYLAMFACCSS